MKTKTKRAFALMLFLAITIATQASTSCLPEGDTSIPAMNLSGLSERKQRIYFGFETTLSLSLWLEPWTTTETIESITWRSDNPAAAKVTETVINGKTATVKVEAYDRGFAVLTGIAKTDGGKTFKLTQKVEVSDEDIELARVSINGVDALYCRYGQSEEGEFYMFRQNPEDPDFVMREENFVMRLNANPAIFPKISGFPSGSDKKLFVVYIDQDNVISSKYFTGFNNLPFKNLNLPTATGIIFTPDVVTLNEGRDVRLYVTATPAGAYDTFMWDPIQAISRDKYVQGVGQVNLPLAFGATRTISFTGRTSNVTQDFQGIVGEELAPSLRVTLSDSDSDKTNRLRIKAACYLNEEYDVMLQGRTLYGDGRWNTLCLPFDLDNFTGTPLESATVKELVSSSYDASTRTLRLNFESVSAIQYGKPYIVRWAEGENIENPMFKEVIVSRAVTPAVETDCVDFVGCYSPMTLAAQDRTVLFLGGDSKLYYPAADVPVNAFRGYFKLKNGLTAGNLPNEAKNFVLDFGDGVTSIDKLAIDSVENAWYSIDGRKLNGEPKAKGIYIHNGKKVIVK